MKSGRRTEEKDDFSYCSTTDAKTRLEFLSNNDFHTTPQKLPDEKPPEVVDLKEERLRSDVLEKKAKRELEADYNKGKVEQQKELDKTKKEFGQNKSKKSFTFDYNGKLLYLKPQREDNIAINEITDMSINPKKAIKAINPPELKPRERVAEILEREGGEKTMFTIASTGEDAKQVQKKGKFSGMFKPAPPVIDIIQVVNGVTIKSGKNQIKVGQPVKGDQKLKFTEFRQKHLGEVDNQKHEDSEEGREKERNRKEAKERKYRRTVDNWKDELERGLKGKFNFDPDLLINLIMTDDLEGDRQKKMQRREEREKKALEYNVLKVFKEVTLEET